MTKRDLQGAQVRKQLASSQSFTNKNYLNLNEALKKKSP